MSNLPVDLPLVSLVIPLYNEENSIGQLFAELDSVITRLVHYTFEIVCVNDASNDDTLSAEDIALGYKGGWIIEACFRRMKQTGLEVRPMFHWTPRRIEAHVKLCVLALQMQRAAEIRCGLPWARIAHVLGTLKAVRYRCESRTIVQRTKVAAELSSMLKILGISVPKQILAVEEAPQAVAAA